MINNTDKDYGNYTLGAGAGYLSYKGTKKLGAQLRKPYTEIVMKQMRNFTSEENALLKQAAYDGFVQSGLKSKKYYLHNVNMENAEFMTNLLDRKSENMKFIKKLRKLQKNRRPFTAKEKEELNKRFTELLQKKEYKKFWEEFKNALKGKPILPETPQEIKNGVKKLLTPAAPTSSKKIIKTGGHKKLAEKMELVAKGKNAFCLPLTRDIMINTDKLAGASFHEMGHALNASGGKLIKSLAIGCLITQKGFIPIILAIGLLKNKKQNGEEPKGIINKTTTYIKNNAGKLTFACLVPMLAEEGLASIRGAKIAKKVLDPKLLKKVNRNNFLAWTTYIAGTLVTTAAVSLAVKIRDKIAQK